MSKKAVVYLYNGILLSCFKKAGNLTFCDNMDGSVEYYVKGNKPARERQAPDDFTFMWNLMNNINKQSEDRLTDTENRLIVIRRGWDGGRVSMVKELSKNNNKPS